MAAPVYATDLVDISTAESTTGWTAIGTGAISVETDYFIQGASCISKVGWTNATRGMIFDNGSGVTFGSLKAFLAWVEYHNANLIDTYANGGLQLIVGSGTGAYEQWFVSGSDKIPYAGWHCFAIDPSAVTRDAITGSPTATKQFFGVLAKVLGSGSLKGNPLGVDVIRHGRELRVTNGDLINGFATIGGAEAYANDVSRRWGLLFNREGAYYMQGALVLGLAGTAVDFRDADRVIFILDTPKCAAGFNEVEIRHASSRVDWTRFTLQALGTQSRGKFTVTDNADVNIDSSSFIDMGVFVLRAGTQMTSCLFLRCDQITAPGSDLRNSKVTSYIGAADTSALVWNVATDPDGKLDGMQFTKGANAHHALEFGTSSPTSITLRNLAFTGFNALHAQNDSVAYFRRTSGTITVNLVGVTGTFSYKTDGAIVSPVLNPVTTSVHVQDVSGNAISGARVFVQVTSSGGGWPFNASVTITSSGTTATVSHTAHGLSTNDWIVIQGANQAPYNGVFQITVTGVNAYTYTMVSSTTSPATGTITATLAIISGTTNASGDISASRTFIGNQPISGWARKASGSPYYKTGLIAGTISSASGLSVTVQMVRDE